MFYWFAQKWKYIYWSSKILKAFSDYPKLKLATGDNERGLRYEW